MAGRGREVVIVITGRPGVRKTTMSRLVAASFPVTVTIRGDDMRALVPEGARDFLGSGSAYRAAAPRASTYLLMGAPRVSFELGVLIDAEGHSFKLRRE